MPATAIREKERSGLALPNLWLSLVAGFYVLVAVLTVHWSIATFGPAHELQPRQIAAAPSPAACCDDCSQCPYPMCNPQCFDPPQKNCDFYANCVEAAVQCGNGGYALGYGQYFCERYQQNIHLFSPQGQAWVYATMHCLQEALVPDINCGATCESIRTDAYASHANCYVESGVCSLSFCDAIVVLYIVGGQLFTSFTADEQAFYTLGLCIAKILGDYSEFLDSIYNDLDGFGSCGRVLGEGGIVDNGALLLDVVSLYTRLRQVLHV